MSKVELRIMRLPHAGDLPLPAYQSEFAAGLDLVAAVPPGVEGQIRPRSGLALRHGITVLNSPGTVDSDYRGEVQVILANFGQASFSVERGARIAQLVLAATLQAAICEVANLDETTRGVGGFGSTGMGEEKANRADRKP